MHHVAIFTNSFNITGTSDPVETSDSTVRYNGPNSGDIVTGTGDTGTDWGSNGGGNSGGDSGSSGGYGGSGAYGGSGGYSGSGGSGSGGFGGSGSGSSGGYGGSGVSHGFSYHPNSVGSQAWNGSGRNGAGIYIATPALTLRPSMIGLDNPAGTAVPKTPEFISPATLRFGGRFD